MAPRELPCLRESPHLSHPPTRRREWRRGKGESRRSEVAAKGVGLVATARGVPLWRGAAPVFVATRFEP